jgi:hypothetical protein
VDHQRVNIDHLSMSCGVAGLSRIDHADIEGVGYAIATRLYHPSRGDPVAFFVWSDVVKDGQKNTLAQWVQVNTFGIVTVSPVADNPKTGNPIAVFTWSINHKRFKNWYATQRVQRLGKVGGCG